MFADIFEIRVTHGAVSLSVALVASLIAYYTAAYPDRGCESIYAIISSRAKMFRRQFRYRNQPLEALDATPEKRLIRACRDTDYKQGLYTFEDITAQYLIAMTAANLNEFY